MTYGGQHCSHALLLLILPVEQCALHSGSCGAVWHSQSLQGIQHCQTYDAAHTGTSGNLQVDAAIKLDVDHQTLKK